MAQGGRKSRWYRKEESGGCVGKIKERAGGAGRQKEQVVQEGRVSSTGRR